MVGKIKAHRPPVDGAVVLPCAPAPRPSARRRVAAVVIAALGTTTLGAVAAPTVALGQQCSDADPFCDDSGPTTTVDPFEEYVEPYIDPSIDPYLDPYLDPIDDTSTATTTDPFDDPTDELPFADLADPTDPADPTGTTEPSDLGQTGAVDDSSIDGLDAGVTDPTTPVVDAEDAELFVAIGESFQTPSMDSVRTRDDVEDDVDVTEVPMAEVPHLTAGRLVLVIDSLAELGAFRRSDNPEIASTLRLIRDVIPADGLTDDGYRAEVRRFDDQLGPAIELLRVDGRDVSPRLIAVDAALPPAFLDSLDSGDPSTAASLDPAPWIFALGDLVARDGAAPEPGADRSDDLSAITAAVFAIAGVEPVVDGDANVDAALAEILDGNPDGADPTSDETGGGDLDGSALPTSPGLSLAISAVGALAAVGATWAFTRRRTEPAGSEPTMPPPPPAVSPPVEPRLSVNDLLDASRRMTASLDPVEIGEIVVAEAHRLVGAEGGLVLVMDDDGLQPVHHEPPGLFRPEILADGDAMARSCLRRVVETGQTSVQVATDEPVVARLPMALTAVPLVADGRVAGAVLVVRVSSRPFDRDDVEALELLAPMVGTALQAATTHGSAAALADIEPLTGLNNRRCLDRDLAAIAEDEQMSYVMIDVDHFKNFNDVNGHSAGDEALRLVAGALEASVRADDRVYRYGGEEFCILLPKATAEEALTVAERARAAVEATDIPGGENQPSGRVTISVGVASAGPAAELVERADAALFQAKRTGRNQVRMAPATTS